MPELDGERVLRIEEKPRNRSRNFAVIGIYFYDATVFDVIRTLSPRTAASWRSPMLTTHYIERGEMTWDELDGWWTDAGTFESLLAGVELGCGNRGEQDRHGGGFRLDNS